MDRAWQRLGHDGGRNSPLESDTDTEVETDEGFASADDGKQQDLFEAARWILHLQREGLHFQRKSETRDVVDGYRALVKAGVCDPSLNSYLDELWENTKEEDTQEFYAADGGDEVAAPGQGSRRGWGLRA